MPQSKSDSEKLKKKVYEAELERLQLELVKLQAWVKKKGLRIVALFEGRDAAGKGGVIKRITQHMNHRVVRVVALPKPTEKEQTQWYFQRYVDHLPSAGEIVLFDRSWYNRALVERVMGFATPEEVETFLNAVPDFERMLLDSGIILVKYWLSVSADKQEERFLERINDPIKRWKISPMDLAARTHWVDYSRAIDIMMERTSIPEAPWHSVNADSQRRARLNCISHLLSLIPYEALPPEPIELPPLQHDVSYQSSDEKQSWVERY